MGLGQEGKEVRQPDPLQMTAEQRPGWTPARQVREDGARASSWVTETHRTENNETRGQEGGRKDESQQHRNPLQEFLILFLLKTKEK